MILISDNKFETLKGNDLIPLQCDCCKEKIFQKKKYIIRKKTNNNFCNNICQNNFSKKKTLDNIRLTGIKKCGICKKIKKVKDFNKSKAQTDGLNKICRQCSNENSKKYYYKNPIKHKEETKKWKKEKDLEIRTFIIDFLIKNPCIDCGEKNIIVLDFDHKDGVEKVFEISEMVSKRKSIKLIKKEIEKCDVKCANCHRIRTAKQLNTYKYVFMQLKNSIVAQR